MSMALSQLLDEPPLGSQPAGGDHVYNEGHRLALEQLLEGGPGPFLDFLGTEKLPCFLSDAEIEAMVSSAEPPHVGDPGPDGSLDCSSLTYFPEVSDLEPPLLELGWPAFTAGSYRGVTRAVAHFQPGYGETVYGCKEAARSLIRGAREVIAIVTDSLTDLDIFKDLQEACTNRNVPVYILLDQTCAPAFLKMCRNISVCLDDLQHMRVRTITGSSYYMRSGVKITGKVHERFTLVDGIKVATGSYRFNWTDGKLNSSNLVELSGQITEKFDEEFRILYAQSSPLSPRRPGEGSLHASLPLKHSVASSPQVGRRDPPDVACLTSTPARRRQAAAATPSPRGPLTPEPRRAAPAACSPVQDAVLAGNASRRPPVAVSRDASTQTDPQPDLAGEGPIAQAPPDAAPTDLALWERQRRYGVIRAKLEHMVSSLPLRGAPADANGAAESHQARCRPRTHKDDIQEPNARLP